MSDIPHVQGADDFFAPITEAEIEAAMALSAEELEQIKTLSAPEPEMISTGELLLLNVETRIGRIADALETANKIKMADRNDIVGLTAQVNRLADALDSIAAVFGCVTESVEGADGVSRCVIRTRDTVPGSLSFRDDGED